MKCCMRRAIRCDETDCETHSKTKNSDEQKKKCTFFGWFKRWNCKICYFIAIKTYPNRHKLCKIDCGTPKNASRSVQTILIFNCKNFISPVFNNHRDKKKPSKWHRTKKSTFYFWAKHQSRNVDKNRNIDG